jgi:hypothetical protein
MPILDRSLWLCCCYARHFFAGLPRPAAYTREELAWKAARLGRVPTEFGHQNLPFDKKIDLWQRLERGTQPGEVR